MGSDSVLMNINKTIVEKALKRVQHETNLPPGYKLGLITEPYYERAVKFAEEYFICNEQINKTMHTVMDQEYRDLWMETLRLDLTLMVVEEDTGDIAAFRSTRVARYDDSLDTAGVKNKATREFLRFSWYPDTQTDFFGRYGVEEAFYFVGLGVADHHQRKGLGMALFKAQLQMLKYVGEELGLDKLIVKGEASSNFAKKIYANCGFEELYDLQFKGWKVDGVEVFTNIGVHTSMKAYGLRII